MADQPQKYTLTALFSVLFIAVIVFNAILIYLFQGGLGWFHFTTIAASLIFFFIALLIFLRLVASPLNKLTNACEKVRKGDLDVRLEIKSQNEIGELIATFNKMISDLKKSQTSFKEARDILEIKVKARTKELEEVVANQEEVIKKRTKDLQDRIEKLERFRRLTVGRELKMIELKNNLRQLDNEGI
jgi:nitrate/nitrite-specific signal transduction histidine kinase